MSNFSQNVWLPLKLLIYCVQFFAKCVALIKVADTSIEESQHVERSKSIPIVGNALKNWTKYTVYIYSMYTHVVYICVCVCVCLCACVCTVCVQCVRASLHHIDEDRGHH